MLASLLSSRLVHISVFWFEQEMHYGLQHIQKSKDYFVNTCKELNEAGLKEGTRTCMTVQRRS